MGVPLIQAYRVGRYIAGRKLRGVKRYPLVLMLEPLFQCNLACAGCGKIDYPKEIPAEAGERRGRTARGGRMRRTDGLHPRW